MSRQDDHRADRPQARTRLLEDADLPAILVALAIPVFFYGIASHGIATADEAYYHGVAEHMVETGQWDEVVFRGKPSAFDTFMNAPLQYWARAALISVVGSSYYSMRWLSALLSIASLLVTFRFTRHLAGPRAGFAAGLVQLTTYQLVYMHAGRTGVIEPFITFFMTLAAFTFVRLLETGRGLVWHHLCLIALVNLKTPVVLIPVLAELAVFALLPSARPHFRRWLAWGAVAAPIGLAWHGFHAVRDFDTFLEVVKKMGDTGAFSEGGFLRGRISNAYYYGSSLLFGAFPWVLLYPVAIRATLRACSEAGPRRGYLVSLAYALAVLLFFLLVGKRYHWYVIPALPFFCVFVGVWLTALPQRRPSNATLAWLGGAVAALALVDVQATRFNPFAIMADTMMIGPRGHSIIGVRSLAALPLLAVALAVAFIAASRRLGPRFSAPFAALVAALFFGYGAVRVVAPLAHVDFVSLPEGVRRQIDARSARGLPLETPIRVPSGQPAGWIARYYFARDFAIVYDEKRGYLLFPRGTPRREIEAELARRRTAKDGAEAPRGPAGK